MSIDYEDSKPFNKISALEYIDGRQSLLYHFLQDRVKHADWPYVANELVTRNPVLLAYVLKLNYERSDEKARIDHVLDMISEEGRLTLMLGAKRHGKTAADIWACEEFISRGIDVFWFGMNPTLGRLYPQIRQTLQINKIEKGVVNIDEAILTFFGRDAMTKDLKARIKTLPTIGHKGAAAIFMSQSIRVDPLLKDLIDYVWFKPLFSFDLFETGLNINPVVKYMLPVRKDENFLLSLQTQEAYIFRNPLPTKWTDELSKPYSLLKTKDEAADFFEKCLEAFSQKEAIAMLEQRGWRPEEIMEEVKPKSKDAKKVKMVSCPNCKNLDYISYGSYGSKKRYRCKTCGSTFTK